MGSPQTRPDGDPWPHMPFNRPALAGSELAFVADAVLSGHTATDGAYTRRVTEALRAAHGAADVVLTTSCTDALELAALLLDIQPGDVVIVPSFTFVSTAVAFVRAGARIRFADIDPVTLNVDPDSVGHLLDDRVRAVVPVHYGGIAADMAGLARVLTTYEGIDVIEDNAHGLFASVDGTPLGSMGRMSTLSFHETKNFTCGEGGALVLNDQSDVGRAHVLRDKGTNRGAFLQGQVDRYSWQDVGSSFGISDILAAFLLGQLEQRDTVLGKRRGVWDRYMANLSPVAAALGLQLPSVAPGSIPGYHLFHVLTPDADARARALSGLAARNIHATFHYVPLHSSPGGRRFGDGRQECPVTDDVSQRLLRLPFHNELTASDIDRVSEALVDILSG